MIPLSNIQSNKLDRLSKILLVQHLNEKPLVFVRFEDIPDQTFCIISGKYIATKEAAISYFFSNFFSLIASAKTTDKLYRESKDACSAFAKSETLNIVDDNMLRGDYFSDSWHIVIAMKDKYEPKEVLGWALEKHVKVI